MQSQTPQTMQPELMTAAEVAKILRRSTPTIRRWAAEGTLKGLKVGERGDWLFHRQTIDALLSQGTQSEIPDPICQLAAGDSASTPAAIFNSSGGQPASPPRNPNTNEAGPADGGSHV